MNRHPKSEKTCKGAASLADDVMKACARLAQFSEVRGETTRTFLSLPMRDVHAFLTAWMQRLGMRVRVDAMGNLRGVYTGQGASDPRRPRLMLGSHVDTVPNAGAYDGVLGVVIGIALIEALGGRRMSFDIEVVAFSEEEGVRFGVPFLGSRAVTGQVDDDLLARQDKDGTTVAQAIRDFGLDSAELSDAALSTDVRAYLEFHIEQGPVLESLGRKLGVVEAIVGQSRFRLTFHGSANHAGTTPMRLRRDALAGAAEWMLEMERIAHRTTGLVATVGWIEATPGAANVIPGESTLSLDVRHASDHVRKEAAGIMMEAAREIAAARGLTVSEVMLLDQAAVRMDEGLVARLRSAMERVGEQPQLIVSGAGHDAMVMAVRVPSAMLFLRSPGGVSHHPGESVLPQDVEAAIAVGSQFLLTLEEGSSQSL